MYVPTIFDKLQDIKLGNIPIPTGSSHYGANLTSSEIKINYPDINDVKVELVNDTFQGIRLYIDEVNMDIQSNISQWFLFIKNTHGNIHASITDLTLDLWIEIDS